LSGVTLILNDDVSAIGASVSLLRSTIAFNGKAFSFSGVSFPPALRVGESAVIGNSVFSADQISRMRSFQDNYSDNAEMTGGFVPKD
jgi:hypothetical protein